MSLDNLSDAQMIRYMDECLQIALDSLRDVRLKSGKDMRKGLLIVAIMVEVMRDMHDKVCSNQECLERLQPAARAVVDASTEVID